jgi:glycosyltransferase involved in cell wall biosynthesis
MSGPPAFSVVIPTYQRRDTVCDAVRALCAVRYRGTVELIVVVDGSTDGTADAVAEIATPFPLRVIEQENSGAATARNRGAAEATGDILLFLDDDMMAAPDLLEQHASSHERGADAVLGHIPLDPASPPGFLSQGVGSWADERAGRLSGGAQLTLFDLLTGQLSVRRSLFEALSGFDQDFTSGGQFGDEDLDFGVRLLESARVEFNPDAISYQRYVVTPKQLIRQWSDAGRADALFARKHPRHAAELFDLHGGNRPLHRMILRPLAALPAVPASFAAAAVWFADRHDRVSPPFRRLVPPLFRTARDLVYWAGVREGGRRLG